MSTALHALALLLRLHLRLMLRPTPGRRRGLPVWARLLAGFLIVLSVSLSLAGLLGVIASGAEGQDVLALLLPWASSWGSLLLFFFAIPVVLAALTYSSDLKLLLLTPLSPRVIIGEKFVMIYCGLALPILVAGCVVVAVLGHALGAGIPYYVAALPALLLLPALPLSVAWLVVVLVLRWIPPAIARNIAVLLGTLLGVLYYLGVQLFNTGQFETRAADLQTSLLHASHAWWMSLPPTWPGHGVAAIAKEHWSTGSLYLGGTLVLAGLLGGLAVTVAAHLFSTGWASYQEASRHTSARAMGPAGASRHVSLDDAVPALSDTGQPVRLVRMRPVWWPLIGKEWRALRRDVQAWARLIYPLVIAAFWGYRTIARMVLAPSGGDIRATAEIGGLLAFLSYLLLASLALPIVNREGRAIYLLALAPLRARDIVLAKWLFCVIPVLGLVETLVVVSAVLQRIPTTWVVLMVLAYAALVISLAGLLMLTSLIWPRLDWDNPRQQVSTTASLAGNFGGLMYAGAICGLLLLTLFWWEQEPLAALVSGSIMFAIAAAAISAVYTIAPRRLDGILDMRV